MYLEGEVPLYLVFVGNTLVALLILEVKARKTGAE